MDDSDRAPGVPHTNKPLLVVAGICLVIPLVALMWVGSYAKLTPTLFGFPFFFWYQFLWVIICSVLTYTAHLLVLAARKGPGSRPGSTTGGAGSTTGGAGSSTGGAPRAGGESA